MSYQLTKSTCVLRLSDGAMIPSDEGNADWQEYQSWLGQGNVPDPVPDPSAVVPSAVTMRQARLALLAAGKLDVVNAAIADMPGDQGKAARIEWEYSQEVQRHKALVLSLAPVLGLDNAQLDALFIMAAGL